MGKTFRYNSGDAYGRSTTAYAPCEAHSRLNCCNDCTDAAPVAVSSTCCDKSSRARRHGLHKLKSKPNGLRSKGKGSGSSSSSSSGSSSGSGSGCRDSESMLSISSSDVALNGCIRSRRRAYGDVVRYAK